MTSTERNTIIREFHAYKDAAKYYHENYPGSKDEAIAQEILHAFRELMDLLKISDVEIPRTCANCAHEESCEWAEEEPITNPEEWECSRFRASERALAAARNGAPKGGEHSGGMRAV